MSLSITTRPTSAAPAKADTAELVPPSGDSPEIAAFADHILKGKAPLANVIRQGREERTAWAEYECQVPVVAANLCFTRSTNPVWEKKEWESMAATVDADKRRIEATLPEGTTVFYLNLIDKNDLIVSTEYEELGISKVAMKRESGE